MADEDDETLHPKRLENPNAKCPKHPDKDLRPLVQLAWDAGWWVERRTYIFLYPLDPTQEIIKVPLTPSDHRTPRNVRGKLRRAGLEI